MPKYKFILYTAGRTPLSISATKNIKDLLDATLTEANYQMEIINLLEHPEAAEQYNVYATPTLLKIAPPPIKAITGDLTDQKLLMRKLDLQ
ncbi:MAG: circadian clock KaiB family protein [Gammaproteobacteria bacterium]|nr:circadian clock KaiB family protein [Gammaproteobacteria bacterium]